MDSYVANTCTIPRYFKGYLRFPTGERCELAFSDIYSASNGSALYELRWIEDGVVLAVEYKYPSTSSAKPHYASKVYNDIYEALDAYNVCLGIDELEMSFSSSGYPFGDCNSPYHPLRLPADVDSWTSLRDAVKERKLTEDYVAASFRLTGVERLTSDSKEYSIQNTLRHYKVYPQ